MECQIRENAKSLGSKHASYLQHDINSQMKVASHLVMFRRFSRCFVVVVVVVVVVCGATMMHLRF